MVDPYLEWIRYYTMERERERERERQRQRERQRIGPSVSKRNWRYD